MKQKALRFGIIIGIAYGSLMVGAIDLIPLMYIVHQVAIVLLLGFWLISLWRSGRGWPTTPFDGPIVAIGLAWTVSAALSRDPHSSLDAAWLIWINILVFYMLVDLIRHQPRTQGWLVEGLFMMGAMIVLFSVFELLAWYFGLPVQQWIVQSWPALYGLSLPPKIHEVSFLFGSNNPTASYCLLLIPLALAGAQTLPRRDLRQAAGALGVGLVGIVLVAQSRGGYLGLAALFGLSALIWLLRPETRARFPKPVRPLLAPRVLLAGATFAGLLASLLVFWLVMRGRNPNDVSRLDLWWSASQMIHDHPLTGVGPRQFGSARLLYLHYTYSYSYLPLQHAHDLVLQVAAEGGLIVMIAAIWLVDRTRRVWWAAWRAGNVTQRRRLEGVLIALGAFAAHNLVDCIIVTRSLIPILIIGAYLAAGPFPPLQPRTVPASRRWPVLAVLGLLVAALLVFIPIDRALWAHMRAVTQLHADNAVQALSDIRDARRFDPWQELYRLQEANILGALAEDRPDEYLNEAIAAYQNALDHNKTWAVGWFNLGVLYAQANDYENASTAVQTAWNLDGTWADYPFALAQYQEHLGRMDDARLAYYAALRRSPWLAASAFWRDPAFPDRAAVLDSVLDYFAAAPVTALDIAVYAGNFEAAGQIAAAAGEHPSEGMRQRIDLLWPDGSDEPCLRCYNALFQSENAQVVTDMAQAEWLWEHGNLPAADGMTAEKAARTAIFLSENRAAWAWYVLARISEQQNAARDVIEARLAAAASYPPDYRINFATTVYNITGDLGVLPQAHTLIMSPISLEPWKQLAALYVADEDWEAARLVYDRILSADPYDEDSRIRQAALPPEP